MIEAFRGGVVGGEGFVSSPSIRLLPFVSKDTDDWTEEIFAIYHQVQVAVGLRKEATEEEIKAQEFIEEVDDAVDSGDANWLDIVKKKFGSDDEEFDFLVGNEEVVNKIGDDLLSNEEGFVL